MGEPYKAEFARELVDKRGETKISFYSFRTFVDMFDGPHVEPARLLHIKEHYI